MFTVSASVIDVVLAGGRQDPHVDVPGTHLAQLEVVEGDDAGDVDPGQVVPDALSLAGDGVGGDGEGSGHRGVLAGSS